MSATPSSESSSHAQASEVKQHPTHTVDLGFIPIPKRLRYDPSKPPHFGIVLNAVFGFASTFVVANLYYCQPLLIQMSKTFGVSDSQVSRIPTLVQAGYATGLVLISPMGDLVRRRPLLLLLIIFSGSLSIGLAVTQSFAVFAALSFLSGVVTVSPQILIPLAADLAPPARRASAISVVLSGLLFGILLARVLAGVVGQFTTWRVVYYMAIGVQYLVWLMLYLVLPDYPSKNPELTYFGILWSMAKYCVTEPMLIQAALMNIASSACFTNFWVTLTFLLGGPPYHYNTLTIGLFGLVGMFGVAMGPLVGRTIDRLVPWYATLTATTGLIIFQSVQTAAGGINIAAVIIACLGLDVFRQMQQVSLTTRVFGIDPGARARLNAIMILSLFIGQVMGTAVGTKVFIEHGWRAAAGLSLAWMAFMLVVLLLRGPHVARYTWFGYEGGLEARKSVVEARHAGSSAAVADGDVEKAQTAVDGEKEKQGGEERASGDTVAGVSEKEKDDEAVKSSQRDEAANMA